MTVPMPPERLRRSLAVVGEQLGQSMTLDRYLAGGEQGGAWMVRTEGGRRAVVKLLLDPVRAARTLVAVPAIARAARGGWPVARWLHTGTLLDGSVFVVQEYVDGRHVTELDATTASAVTAANACQHGLAEADAFDHATHHDAVLSEGSAWRTAVAAHSPAGAALVAHADRVIRWTGRPQLPRADVVHGDYSRPNLLLTADGSIRFVDAETVGRGSRVSDLADLYRHAYVYGHASPDGLAVLRAAAVAVAGPDVFAVCGVASALDNLTWWAENRTRSQFDQACARLRALFDDLDAMAS